MNIEEADLRVASAELIQLAVWLQMLSRAEEGASPDQIALVLARVDAGLRRVRVLKEMNGDGETPAF